ncbi:hypothetical protein GQ457_06G002830 [Hibiscus cannabinus]
MTSQNRQLHVFFFPFMAPGHSIPIIDLAILFAGKGVKSTIIAPPSEACHIYKVTEKPKKSGYEVDVLNIEFPVVEAGLPEGCESLDKFPSPDMLVKFFLATELLKRPLEDLIRQHRPHCLVSDMFFPWTNDVAAASGIPRILFHGTCAFSFSAMEHVRLYEPHKNVSSDSEPFLIPKFPGDIKLTRSQLPDFVTQETWFIKLFNEFIESGSKSFGVIVNSFYELEPVYADHYTNFLGRKAWHVGPVSLSTKGIIDKTNRGKQSSIDENECLNWLKLKEPNSVIYVCFGSMADFDSSVSAGVPVITWPVAAKQFYNEKLLTEVLKIGVGVGARKWKRLVGDFVRSEAIEKAVREVIAGECAVEMRNRAKRLAEMAKKAVENGGSSDSHLNALIGELKSLSP